MAQIETDKICPGSERRHSVCYVYRGLRQDARRRRRRELEVPRSSPKAIGGHSKMEEGSSVDHARILVIADTHNRLPGNIYQLGEGVSEIWHLGDVCQPGVLHELSTLGPPVTLVRGNCDSEMSWPEEVNLTRSGVRFRLQHIAPPARHPPRDCDVLLHGHTHVPRDETIDGVRFLNPGCVTRANQGAPASVALLEWKADVNWEWRLVRLPEKRP